MEENAEKKICIFFLPRDEGKWEIERSENRARIGFFFFLLYPWFNTWTNSNGDFMIKILLQN